MVLFNIYDTKSYRSIRTNMVLVYNLYTSTDIGYDISKISRYEVIIMDKFKVTFRCNNCRNKFTNKYKSNHEIRMRKGEKGMIYTDNY